MSFEKAREIISEAKSTEGAEGNLSFEEAKERAIEESRNCIFCGITSDKYSDAQALMGHHLNGDENDNREENVIIVCGACHKGIHRRGNGVFEPFHNYLPKESIYTSEDMQKLSEERDKKRPDDRCVLRIRHWGDTEQILKSVGKLNNPSSVELIEKDRSIKLEFENEKLMYRFGKMLNQNKNISGRVRKAHPQVKDTRVTHTLSI